MDNTDWFENILADTFNGERDAVARVLTEKIEEVTNEDVYDMAFGNWNDISVKAGKDDDSDRPIHITSRRDEEGVIHVTMRSGDGLFEGDINLTLVEEAATSFDNTMVFGQMWDVYSHIRSHPVPDLTENYDPYKLPPLPTDKRL